PEPPDSLGDHQRIQPPEFHCHSLKHGEQFHHRGSVPEPGTTERYRTLHALHCPLLLLSCAKSRTKNNRRRQFPILIGNRGRHFCPLDVVTLRRQMVTASAAVLAEEFLEGGMDVFLVPNPHADEALFVLQAVVEDR